MTPHKDCLPINYHFDEAWTQAISPFWCFAEVELASAVLDTCCLQLTWQCNAANGTTAYAAKSVSHLDRQ